MKKKFKFLILIFVCTLIVTPLIVNAADWSHSGAGGSGSWSGSYPAAVGGWSNQLVGVRVTAVDTNGKRLDITVNGQRYVSRSIDFYSQRYFNNNDLGWLLEGGNVAHSVCVTSTGLSTYCSKAELAGGFSGNNGGYSAELWPYSIPLPTQEYPSGDYAGPDFSQTFRQFAYQQNFPLADDLLARLMGISFDAIENNSGDSCEENIQKINGAYIIYEPIGKIYNMVGTASELGIMYSRTVDSSGHYSYRALPNMYNAAYVPTSTGNLGLNYFSPVSGPMPSALVYDQNASIYAARNAADNNNIGYGVGILKFSDIGLTTDEMVCEAYDYSIDAACVNCYVKNYDNRAYIIQDTTDWDAIMASSSSNISNVKNYYDKGNGIFCREEFLIEYPDANNYVTTSIGRYFLINATAEEEYMVTNNHPVNGANLNFRPIRVTKTRECRSSSNNVGALQNFENLSRSTFLDNAGTITLTYKENKSDSRYNKKITLKPKIYYNTDNNKLTASQLKEKGYSSKIENNTLTMKQTISYTLPNNVYRYISKDGSVSLYSTNGVSESDLKTKYIDMGISTLPISFNGSATDHFTDEDYTVKQLASIQLQYELPSDTYSKMKNAYVVNNDYFKSADANAEVVDNVYKKYINGEINENDEQLKQSACAKLYGSTASNGFKTCATQRVDNKIGVGNNNCFNKNDPDVSNENIGYVCPIMSTPTNEEDSPKCKVVNGVYYGENGNVITKEQYNQECSGGNNTGPKYCQVVDNVYYGLNGDVVSEAEYHMQCEKKYDCDIVKDASGNTVYYGLNGDVVTQEDWQLECLVGPQCKIENGIYYGKNGTPISYERYQEECGSSAGLKCQVVNGLYYGSTGQLVTYETYRQQCGSSNNSCVYENGVYYGPNGQPLSGYEEYTEKCDETPTKPICTEENGGDRWNPLEGECCLEGQIFNEEVGECYGIPTFNDSDICYIENGVYYGVTGQVCSKAQWYNECKNAGGIKVIYRPIDLTIPFPGQDADGGYRNTGSNWCSYVNGVVDCSYNNSVSKKVVIDDRAYTYSGTPMYSITLDTDKINYIRDYNNKHKYDDFELNCTDGKACLSEFLDLGNLDVTFRSGCHSSSNFYSTSCLGSGRS